MNRRAFDIEFAETDVRIPKAKNADGRMNLIDADIGLLAGGFAPMQNDAGGVRLKLERMPGEGSDLRAAAGGIFKRGNQAFARQVLKEGGAENRIGEKKQQD
ncbi:MAG TPA: hypothetical protein VGS58_11845, partial [Candidatus Sulfopaludibacter sp.]|nr:hypothetical protein [Candidatus Sulfopaludibacter sp.]